MPETPLNDMEAESTDVSFSVMPQDDDQGPMYSQPEPVPTPRPGPAPATPPANGPQPTADLPTEESEQDQPAPSRSHKLLYVIIGVVVVLGLAAAAYFMLGSSPEEAPSDTRSLSKVWLQRYFGSETCADQIVCGVDADPDNDGLGNYEEFRNGSDPRSPDTDGDGLADGDEVNIYLTDPVKKFTDSRPAAIEAGYHDGSQIKNDYDPLTPNIKMTDTRKAQIAAKIEQYKLHEPTITTLNASSGQRPQAATASVFIENGAFSPTGVTINAGDTVVWLNKDQAARQLASNSLTDLKSEPLTGNQTYSYTFLQVGTFSYYDSLNPATTGTVIVK